MRALMDDAEVLNLDTVEDSIVGTTNRNERDFWAELAQTTLKPESANLGKVEKLKEKLRSLRNTFVLVLLITNVMWIVFLYTLVFPELTKYNLPSRGFSLLFLSIFSIIFLIQFVAMLLHRLKTLFHWLAGIKPKDSVAAVWAGNDEEFENVSVLT